VRFREPQDLQRIFAGFTTPPERPFWVKDDAVMNHRVIVNPKGLFWWCRETSEEALQFLWLAKTLYPQRFADINMVEETRDFYLRFFGLTLSDAQINEILTPSR